METETIAKEILRKRTRESMKKREHIHLTLPIGTIESIREITDDYPSTFCQKIILEYIKKPSAKEE